MDQNTVDDNNDSEMEGADNVPVDGRVSSLPPGHHPNFAPIAMHNVIHFMTISIESVTANIS